jgi:hypothetical protein
MKPGDDMFAVAPYLTGEYDAKRDTVMVAVDELGKVRAVMLSRPVCLVHGCWVDQEVHAPRERISIIQRLVDYGIGYIKALGATEAVFLTDDKNETFRSLIADRGGYEEVAGQISTLEVE